ncbi:MAG: hypothetical protein BGO21_29840 [Dyadobacter sp. 50-39]|uniref:Crp/Fnr family transcriptional regulator n=1 Tax=Dyadobacter sp. 50-39 TaxID=1895756 RepID=UPI000959E51B|nr:hypothetical protein [Dyadobacter sp. 50-39]OJV15209.1 MAG: hypothetical protein BGO21_29840 [Dyadobacter sp. 50-39]
MSEHNLIEAILAAYDKDEALAELLNRMPVNRTLRKGQILCKDTDRPQAFFVHNGTVKGFYYDENGRERVTRFWRDRQIILLTNAQQDDIATADHLQALECARLSVFTQATALRLGLTQLQTARFAARILLLDRNLGELKAHLCAMPARQAYAEFQHHFFAYKLPLRDTASFLGITPQTLSEIRKK